MATSTITKDEVLENLRSGQRAHVRRPDVRHAYQRGRPRRATMNEIRNRHHVRGIDESLVQALKHRAAKHGRSAEAEHREILATALRRPRKRRLAEALAAIPNVGKDEDFARIEDAAEARRVPD